MPKGVYDYYHRIGKTYEELYGVEKAQQIKAKLKAAQPKRVEKLRALYTGKTYDERYGEKKDEILKKSSVSLTGQKRSAKAKKKMSLAHKGKRTGAENSAWRGGESYKVYGYDFNEELQLAVRIRDGYKCAICGVHEDDIQKRLSVHHINYKKKDNRIENLVALCIGCHGRTNGRRQRWLDYFSRSRSIETKTITWDDVRASCLSIANFLRDKKVTGLVPILRGGGIPAVMLSYRLDVPIKERVETDFDVIVDEIVDFGIVFRNYRKKYPNNLFVCIHLNKDNFKLKIKPDFYVEEVNKYIIYPWEEVDRQISVSDVYKEYTFRKSKKAI